MDVVFVRRTTSAAACAATTAASAATADARARACLVFASLEPPYPSLLADAGRGWRRGGGGGGDGGGNNGWGATSGKGGGWGDGRVIDEDEGSIREVLSSENSMDSLLFCFPDHFFFSFSGFFKNQKPESKITYLLICIRFMI